MQVLPRGAGPVPPLTAGSNACHLQVVATSTAAARSCWRRLDNLGKRRGRRGAAVWGPCSRAARGAAGLSASGVTPVGSARRRRPRGHRERSPRRLGFRASGGLRRAQGQGLAPPTTVRCRRRPGCSPPSGWKAAPVLWSQAQVLVRGAVEAVVLNAGVRAKSCTGPAGFADTHQPVGCRDRGRHRGRARRRRPTPGSSRSIGSRTPISPVEATATRPAPVPSAVAHGLGGPVGVREAGRAGAGVGAAGVEHDGLDRAAGERPAATTARGRPSPGWR